MTEGRRALRASARNIVTNPNFQSRGFGTTGGPESRKFADVEDGKVYRSSWKRKRDPNYVRPYKMTEEEIAEREEQERAEREAIEEGTPKRAKRISWAEFTSNASRPSDTLQASTSDGIFDHVDPKMQALIELAVERIFAKPVLHFINQALAKDPSAIKRPPPAHTQRTQIRGEQPTVSVATPTGTLHRGNGPFSLHRSDGPAVDDNDDEAYYNRLTAQPPQDLVDMWDSVEADRNRNGAHQRRGVDFMFEDSAGDDEPDTSAKPGGGLFGKRNAFKSPFDAFEEDW